MNGKTNRILLVTALAWILIVAGAASATVVPYTATRGSNNKDNYSGNMSDLSSGEEITKGDVDDPSTWTASGGNYQNEWQAGALLSGAANSKIAWVALDLGSVVTNLQKAYLWNIRQATGQNARTVTYNVYTAESPSVTPPVAPTNGSVVDYNFASGGWTLLNTGGALIMPQRGPNGSPADQVLNLGGISAQYIGFEILTNAGSTGRAGFSEIAITAAPATAVPEPATAAFGLLAMAGLARRRRRLA